MNIEIVKSLTHRLCRMFGHFYGELWKLEEKKIEVMQLLKAVQKKKIWSKKWIVHLGKHWAANSRGQGTPAACKATRQGTWAQDIWSGTWKPVRPPVRTLGVGEKVSRLTLEQERVGVSVCKSEGAVLLEQGGTLLPVLSSWKVENLWKFGGLPCSSHLSTWFTQSDPYRSHRSTFQSLENRFLNPDAMNVFEKVTTALIWNVSKSWQ